ncbi:uroporphyrinogen decarboxylase family protein [Anaerosalibacter sp. Marseille-P3206]|uniref:uroporphyrinogen decarboxylase family protein n=1 Tax=Anaerosalibacter sp. Marseille-P3206 TaxID=1871005 RepID=UPI00350F305B
MPCPYKDGRMPTNIKAYELISQKFDKPLAVSVPGPFTIAAELAGVTHIARSIIRNPGFVNGLVDFTTRMVSNYSKAITKHGVRLICISEPTGIILSPKKFEELISSNLRKVFVNLDTDAWKVLHVCGDSTHLLQQHQLLFFLCFFP